jgi:hypothetical protein
VRKPARAAIVVNCFDQMSLASAPRRRLDRVPGKKISITHHIPKLQPCSAVTGAFRFTIAVLVAARAWRSSPFPPAVLRSSV